MGGIALSTAVIALYYRLNLPVPWLSTPIPRANAPILIWAGSTSVGLFAIHLAKLSNIPVVTTASPHNHELVKSLGADAVFDYKDPEVASKIKAWVKGNGYQRFDGALDNISEHGSTELVASSLGEFGGKIITLRACLFLGIITILDRTLIVLLFRSPHGSARRRLAENN